MAWLCHRAVFVKMSGVMAKLRARHVPNHPNVVHGHHAESHALASPMHFSPNTYRTISVCMYIQCTGRSFHDRTMLGCTTAHSIHTHVVPRMISHVVVGCVRTFVIVAMHELLHTPYVHTPNFYTVVHRFSHLQCTRSTCSRGAIVPVYFMATMKPCIPSTRPVSSLSM